MSHDDEEFNAGARCLFMPKYILIHAQGVKNPSQMDSALQVQQL
jgi:hypothetical protein